MDAQDGRWSDWDTGPVSRPYMLTGGRTRPRGDRFYALLDVVGRGPATPDRASLGPERIRILDICRVPATVADLASEVDLPLGVVRILLDDLAQERLIEVRAPAPTARVTDKQLLRQILDGLNALLGDVPVPGPVLADLVAVRPGLALRLGEAGVSLWSRGSIADSSCWCRSTAPAWHRWRWPPRRPGKARWHGS
jgi:hypothetical protein